jgi:hypothetical protein
MGDGYGDLLAVRRVDDQDGYVHDVLAVWRLGRVRLMEATNPTADWVPPWRIEEEPVPCIECGIRVIATTLTPWGVCCQCMKDHRADDTGQMRLL